MVFGGTTSQDITVSIYTSATGESGSKVSINRSMLLSALTIDAGTLSSAAWTGAANGTFAVSVASKQWTCLQFPWEYSTKPYRILLHFELKNAGPYHAAIRSRIGCSTKDEPGSCQRSNCRCGYCQRESTTLAATTS